MSDVELVINVLLLFVLRIGVPVTIMLVLGTLVEKYQQRKHHDA